MNRHVFSIIAVVFLLLSVSPSVLAATIPNYKVEAMKTNLKRGEVFEARLESDSINENMTINLVFDGTEYFASGGGGACRSDNGMFLGWMEDGEHPIARILCTVPTDLPKTVTKVEMIAYQFRECDGGAERCSEVKSSQTFTLEPIPDDQKEATPSADTEGTIRLRIKDVFDQLFKDYQGWDSAGDDTGNDDGSGDNGNNGGNNGGNTNPPAEVTNADCKRHSSASLQYTCQVYADLKRVCTQYKPGQVMPENRVCVRSASSVPPNAQSNQFVNAGYDYDLTQYGISGIRCPAGGANRSRGLQCMGFAQSVFGALKNDMSDGSNPFMGVGAPQGLVNDGDIRQHFDVVPLSSCKSQVQAGKPIWFIWGFHIAIGAFMGESKDTIEFYEGNFDYCGTVNYRKENANGSGVTHCLIPKTLQ